MAEREDKLKRLESMRESFSEQIREIKDEIAKGSAENPLHSEKLAAIEEHLKMLENEIRTLRSSEMLNG